MPLIPKVGRKSRTTRAAIWAVYVILVLGSVTMLYPFAIMLSASISSEVDSAEYRIIPRYLYNDDVLFRKYAERKYAKIEILNRLYGTNYFSFSEIEPPDHETTADLTALASAKSRLPNAFLMMTELGTPEMPGRTARNYRVYLRKLFRDKIDTLNSTYRSESVSFSTVDVTLEDPTSRMFVPRADAKTADWVSFKRSLPSERVQVVQPEPLFRRWLRARYYDDLKALNKTWATHYTDWSDVPFARSVPKQGAADWEKFVRRELPLPFVDLNESMDAYRQFLVAKYKTIAAYNVVYKGKASDWGDIKAPIFVEGPQVGDWRAFVEYDAPVEALQIRKLPGGEVSISAADHAEMKAHPLAVRWSFIARNYRESLDYMLVHGRAFFNTAVLVLAMVLTHLIVNPMAAYALSRFNLSYAYKILLFCLATMAFPAEVAMIPNFLLLKQFHMLNTFWALILPGLASGFSIFLLKGFFDALPRDLYEAATLDGAGFMRQFWQIAVPLSKPVLAVIALHSFAAAYGSFMWAFVVCQDPHMWTLMVWLYEMQQWAPKYLLMSALVLAAIPTLAVFVFCQNIIMRGIILPVEQ